MGYDVRALLEQANCAAEALTELNWNSVKVLKWFLKQIKDDEKLKVARQF